MQWFNAFGADKLIGGNYRNTSPGGCDIVFLLTLLGQQIKTGNMKKVLFILMLLMVIPSISHAQKLQWTKGYYQDEFNEDIQDAPYYLLNLPAKASGCYGKYLGIMVSAYEGIKFLDYDKVLGSYHYIKIKAADGTVYDIPWSFNGGYVVDRSYLNLVIDILKQGNFSISISGYNGVYEDDLQFDSSISAKVVSQTKSITTILKRLGVY